MKLFFEAYLPANFPKLSADKRKYLYLTTLAKLLASLEPGEQKELIQSLQSSETTAQLWISQNKFAKDLLKEHLERMKLSLQLE